MGLVRHARQRGGTVLGLVRRQTAGRHRSGWLWRGLEPRDPRRLLVEHPGRLPVGEPQPHRPVAPPPGLPCGPQSGGTVIVTGVSWWQGRARGDARGRYGVTPLRHGQ